MKRISYDLNISFYVVTISRNSLLLLNINLISFEKLKKTIEYTQK